MWNLNNTLLNDKLVKEKIKKEIKAFLEFNENEDITYPNVMEHSEMEHNENSAKRKTYCSEGLQKRNRREHTLAVWQHIGKL